MMKFELIKTFFLILTVFLLGFIIGMLFIKQDYNILAQNYQTCMEVASNCLIIS